MNSLPLGRISIWFCDFGPEMFDLEKNYASYRARHSNSVNISIHVVIVFFGILMLHFTPPIFHAAPTVASLVPSVVADVLVLNYGFLLTIFYAFLYVSMDVRVSPMAAVLVFLSWAGSRFLANSPGYSLSGKVVLGTLIVLAILGVFGHAVFEKQASNYQRASDYLQIPFETLLHPFFISLQVLQILFEYEPYPGFEESVQKRVASDVEEWKAKSKKTT